MLQHELFREAGDADAFQAELIEDDVVVSLDIGLDRVRDGLALVLERPLRALARGMRKAIVVDEVGRCPQRRRGETVGR